MGSEKEFLREPPKKNIIMLLKLVGLVLRIRELLNDKGMRKGTLWA